MIRLKDLLTEQERYAMPFQPERYLSPGMHSGAELVSAAEKAQADLHSILVDPDFFEWGSLFLEAVPIIGPYLGSAALTHAADLRLQQGENLSAALDLLFAALPIVGPYVAAATNSIRNSLIRVIQNKYSLAVLSKQELQQLKQFGNTFVMLLKDEAKRERLMRYILDTSIGKRALRVDPVVYDKILKLLRQFTLGNPVVARKVIKEIADLMPDLFTKTGATEQPENQNK